MGKVLGGHGLHSCMSGAYRAEIPGHIPNIHRPICYINWSYNINDSNLTHHEHYGGVNFKKPSNLHLQFTHLQRDLLSL